MGETLPFVLKLLKDKALVDEFLYMAADLMASSLNIKVAHTNFNNSE